MLEQEIASRAAYDAYEIPLPAKKPETEEANKRRERQEQIERWQKALRDDEARLAKKRARETESSSESDLKTSPHDTGLESIGCAAITNTASIKEKDERCQNHMNRVQKIANSSARSPTTRPKDAQVTANEDFNLNGSRLEKSVLDAMDRLGYDIEKEYASAGLQALTTNLRPLQSWAARSSGIIVKGRYQMPTSTIMPTRTILSDRTMETNVQIARKEEEILKSALQDGNKENWDLELDELSLEELIDDQEL
jgi:hypothetical protein